MKNSRFTLSQIVTLRERDRGVPIAELIRKTGISRATYFLWKPKYGGATVAELRPSQPRSGAAPDLLAEAYRLRVKYRSVSLTGKLTRRPHGIGG